MIKLALNKHKFNNYAFFCPVSRLHLTVSNPVGMTSEVTPAILKAVKSKTLIDVDGVIDIETGTVKDAQPVKTPVQEAPKSPDKTNDVDTEKDNSAEQSNSVENDANEVPKSTKKGKSKLKETVDEKTE